MGWLPSGPTPLCQEEAGRSPGVESVPVPLRILGASFPSPQSGENVKIVATALPPGVCPWLPDWFCSTVPRAQARNELNKSH